MSSAEARKTYTRISILVGEGSATQNIQIPRKAMKACRYFQEKLEDGSRIPKVDPKIFQVVIDYLSTSVISKARGADIVVFKTLFEENALLNFAKAWVLGHEFELPEIQNRLVDAYSKWYTKLLLARNSVKPSAAAFAWLRDHVANHTPAEKFLVDFAAGMRRYKDIRWATDVNNDLPQDIATYIDDRFVRVIAVEGSRVDRILNNDHEFKICMGDKHVKSKTLKILPPLYTPPMVLGPPAATVRPATARMDSSTSLRSIGSIRTIKLFRTANSSLVSFPPLGELDGKSELKEETSDDDSVESVDFSRFPNNLWKLSRS